MRLEFPGENGHLGLSSFPHSDRQAAEARVGGPVWGPRQSQAENAHFPLGLALSSALQ